MILHMTQQLLLQLFHLCLIERRHLHRRRSIRLQHTQRAVPSYESHCTLQHRCSTSTTTTSACFHMGGGLREGGGWVTYQKAPVEPLGSPQGAHDAAAHLFGVPHRVEHAACCRCCRCAEGGGGGGVLPPLRLLSLLLQAPGWLRWCWLESRRWEGGFTPPCVPPPSSSSSSPSQTQTGSCRGADGGDQMLKRRSREEVVLLPLALS